MVAMVEVGVEEVLGQHHSLKGPVVVVVRVDDSVQVSYHKDW